MIGMHVWFVLGLLVLGIMSFIWGLTYKKRGRKYIFLIGVMFLSIAAFNAYWFKEYSFWHENYMETPQGELMHKSMTPLP